MAFLLFPLVSSLTAQPTSTNRVLELDGKDSYVELPANLFTNEVVTVEGWVKWRKFGDYSRFFEFGDAALMIGVIDFGSASELTIQRVHNRAYEGQTLEKAPADYLSADQWRHVAMVAGTNFLKLYVNGALVATENSKNNWKPGQVPVLKNFLGRSVVKEAGNNPDFNGQMAEIRLWAGERTAKEIRTNIPNRLTGREPGLPPTQAPPNWRCLWPNPVTHKAPATNATPTRPVPRSTGPMAGPGWRVLLEWHSIIRVPAGAVK